MVFKIKNPILIVGAPHSGTSIAIAILSQLKNVYTFEGESAIFYNETYGGLQKIENKTIENGKKRWIEKTPIHIKYIDKILEFFPEAKIVLMVKDGRDVVNSLYKRWKRFDTSLLRWIEDNEAGLKYKNHNSVLYVYYEDLIADTIPTLKKICKFVNEPYQNDLLDYYKKPKYWYSNQIVKKEYYDQKTIRNWQINQPLFDGRNKWKKELDEKFVIQLKNNKRFNNVMNQLGYKW